MFYSGFIWWWLGSWFRHTIYIYIYRLFSEYEPYITDKEALFVVTAKKLRPAFLLLRLLFAMEIICYNCCYWVLITCWPFRMYFIHSAKCFRYYTLCRPMALCSESSFIQLCRMLHKYYSTLLFFPDFIKSAVMFSQFSINSIPISNNYLNLNKCHTNTAPEPGYVGYRVAKTIIKIQ